jgi:hypothetical protein
MTQSPARTTGVYGPPGAAALVFGAFFAAVFFAADFFAAGFFAAGFFAADFFVDVFFFAAMASTL